MKPERAFIAERSAAVHCPELLRSGPAPAELMPRFGQLGERFAKAFGPALAAVTGGVPAQARASAARADEDIFFYSEVGSLAANTLFAVGAAHAPLLVSIDAGAVLAVVDRTFGGRGEAPSPMPDHFPMSAELMIARLEEIVGRCLAEALGAEGAGALRVLRRDGSLSSLAPFPEGAPLAVVKVEVEEPGGAPWPINLSCLQDALPALLGEQGGHSAIHPPRAPGSPLDEPFADIPLELSAVLVDMRISMAAIAAIQPGSVLPVAVARAVPLKLGGKTLATGSIGEADDRVAIQITRAFD